MSKLLALDWDRQEVRCVLAASQAERLQVIAAASAPLVDVAQGAAEARPDVAGSLRAALADLPIGRARTLVGVDRASVELLNLTLPPAKDSELAELVTHQVMRESQLAGEEALLDFVALDDDPSEPRQVAAAVLSRTQRERIREVCAGAGLRPFRIVLRPFAAASLFARTAAPAERVCLLVNVVTDEADLAVLVEGKVVFLRTVRLPHGVGEQGLAQRLSSEIQRTLVVAQQGPLGGNAVEGVFLFGAPGEHRVLLEHLATELALPATLLDPFATVSVPAGRMPQRPGRFAALVGMILDEVHGAHALDFLHPRRPARRPDRRRPWLLAAVLAAALVFWGAYLLYKKTAELDVKNKDLAATLQKLNNELKRIRPDQRLIDAVYDWQQGEVVWLDELRDLALCLPSSRHLLLQKLTALPHPDGATVQMQGLLADPALVAYMETDLRDDYRYNVRSERITLRDPNNPKQQYPWSFLTSMVISPREKAAYRGRQASPP
ncbi:MAG: type IV pilus biogenesis protein PilM [Thermoguttaceae bacterium]